MEDPAALTAAVGTLQPGPAAAWSRACSASRNVAGPGTFVAVKRALGV